MEENVRYCTTEDGVRIAYKVSGEGLPLLFVHYIYAFSLSHLVPSYDEAVQRLARGRQLIRYDMRGTGLSQRDDIADISPDALVKDIEAVVKALGMSRFAFLGASSGGPRVIQYTSEHPDQVAALILYETYPGLGDLFPPEMIQMFSAFARLNWQFATRTLSDVAIRTQDPADAQRWMQLTYESTTGDTMARLVESHVGYDVSHLLAGIECPTLVCHSRNDLQWPFMLGQKLAEGIPNARLVPLENDQTGAFTDPEAAIAAIEDFLARPLPGLEHVSIPSAAAAKPLTPREIEILRLISAGLTSKEISRQLDLSIRTVGRHISNIYEKIDARGRADATAYALRHGITAD